MNQSYQIPSLDDGAERLVTTDSRIRRCIEKAMNKKIELWQEDGIRRIANEIMYLFKSYKSNSKTISYSSLETQIAYVIAYYPNYIETVNEILKIVNIRESSKKEDSTRTIPIYENWIKYFAEKENQKFNIAILGSGPAPELYGLKRFFDRLFYSSKLNRKYFPEITVDLFESQPDWQWTIQYVTKALMYKTESIQRIGTNFIQTNLSNQFSSDHKELKDSYHLIILQNVANEILEENKFFMENLKLFLKRVKPEIGYCVVATRGRQNSKLMTLIRDHVEHESHLRLVIDERSELDFSSYQKQDRKLKKHIFSQIPFEYRSMNNNSKAIVIKSVKV